METSFHVSDGRSSCSAQFSQPLLLSFPRQRTHLQRQRGDKREARAAPSTSALAVSQSGAANFPTTPHPQPKGLSSTAASGIASGISVVARFDFAVDGLFYMEVDVSLAGAVAQRAAQLACASQHHASCQLRLQQLLDHCRGSRPDILKPQEFVMVVAEFDAREDAPGWTYQRFLKARLAVLKKLGLKLAEDAAKTAGLREAEVWEAENQLSVHHRQVKADDLAGRMEKLEQRIVDLKRRRTLAEPQQPPEEIRRAVQAGLRARSQEFSRDLQEADRPIQGGDESEPKDISVRSGSIGASTVAAESQESNPSPFKHPVSNPGGPLHDSSSSSAGGSGKDAWEQALGRHDKLSKMEGDISHDRPAVEALGLQAAQQELVSTRIELAASKSEQSRLDDQLVRYLQEAVQAFEGVLVQWCEQQLPPLQSQPAGEGNAATATLRVNLMTNDNVASSERIQVQATGPEIGFMKAKVAENAAAFLHGRQYPQGLSQAAFSHIPLQPKLANLAFQSVLIDQESSVQRFMCRFRQPALQSSSSVPNDAGPPPVITGSEVLTTPESSAEMQSSQVSPATAGEKDTSQGVIIGNGADLAAMITCLDAYLTHPATMRPLNKPARPDNHFMPGEAYQENVPVRLKFVPVKGMREPAISVLGMGGTHVVQAQQGDGSYRTLHLSDGQLGAWQHCCDAFLQRQMGSGWHPIQPPGPNTMQQGWASRLPSIPGSTLLRSALQRLRR
ncbi:hypothetical protein WJX74_008020 [Apatococcus lobatus]|uniref:Uncharacterized protein n=1 Tax=Apatococcus lobatus TaxID=904363 RepID=A0AAW1RGA9_9CHLO